MLVTNAVSLRFLSALKRVKTYISSTTGEARSNNLVLLHVHKELVDGIDIVGDNQRRKRRKSAFASKATQTV